jgi:hypothetical protein
MRSQTQMEREGGQLHQKREKWVSRKSWGNILIIFLKKCNVMDMFYPKFSRVGNGS